MGILDPAKLAVVFVIAFLVLGPDRFPGLARRLGSTWRRISDTRDHAEQELRSAVSGLELPTMDRFRPTEAASNFLSDLTRLPQETEYMSEVTGVREQGVASIDPGRLDRSQVVGIGRILALSSSQEETETVAGSGNDGTFDAAMN